MNETTRPATSAPAAGASAASGAAAAAKASKPADAPKSLAGHRGGQETNRTAFHQAPKGTVPATPMDDHHGHGGMFAVIDGKRVPVDEEGKPLPLGDDGRPVQPEAK